MGLLEWRGVIATVFLAACTLDVAVAGPPPCDQQIRFSAGWFADPELDTSKSSAQVTAIGAAVSGKGTQIGHVMVETKLAVVPQTTCAGYLVRLEFIKPVLRVASEIPPGTCAYARVVNHEQTHVRIYRDMAREFRQLDYPWGKGANAPAILSFAKLELDRLMQAQVRFDSPEEYGRNQTLCGGEILRLVKGMAPAVARKPG